MTEAREGVSRRGFIGIATPAAAQQGAVMAEATSEDYVRDPVRWGGPEVAALFSLPTGHHMQEEAPEQIYEHFVKFFTT